MLTKVAANDTNNTVNYQHIYLRPNLHTALKYLRQPDVPRVMWIDALCINQNDLDERGRQVKRMAEIFTLAERVVVWLGPAEANPSSQRALRILEMLGEQIEFSKTFYYFCSPASGLTPRADLWSTHDIETVRAAVRNNHQSTPPPLPLNESDMSSVHHLVSRPWWDRLWVFQEIQLASHKSILLCGKDSAYWSLVRRAIMWLHCRSVKRPDLPLTTPILSRCYYLAVSQVGAPIIHVLFYTERAQYTVENDRIIAVLGLAPPAIAAHIKPDYTVPVHQFFRDVCLAILRVNKSLVFLGDRETEDTQPIPGKPSWVPNWLEPVSLRPFFGARAAGGSFDVLVPKDALDTLPVQCIFKGSVRLVAPRLPAEGDIASTIELWDAFARSSSSGDEGMMWKNSLVDILKCGLWNEKWPDRAVLSLEQGLKAYDQRKYASFTEPAARRRAFFISSNGSFGLGPPMAKEGKC